MVPLFPFIGTRAYDIAKVSGSIDFAKMDRLDNFTDETCMRLGEDEDLLVNKLKTLFCLYVNGSADMDGKGSTGPSWKRWNGRTAWHGSMKETALLQNLHNWMRRWRRRGKPATQ